MADDQANANEGADPSTEISKQNPGGTTTADIVAGSGTPDDDEAEADADAMEDVQEDAAEERENNGGYQ